MALTAIAEFSVLGNFASIRIDGMTQQSILDWCGYSNSGRVNKETPSRRSNML
jgi:hypothetical protein